ncbi:MAG: hypothetical protein AAFR16_06400 [Pseudomonadota bacterium]
MAIAAGAPQAAAGEADVMEAVATPAGGYGDVEIWRFEVTVLHVGTSWQHYVSIIEVLAPNGALLGERRLYAPSLEDETFTTTIPQVEIPAGVTEVTVRAHDSVHGYGGRTVTVLLEAPETN